MRLEKDVDLLVIVDHMNAGPPFVPRESGSPVVVPVENHVIDGHMEPGIPAVITEDKILRSLQRVIIQSEDVHLGKAQASGVMDESHNSALVPGPVPVVVGLQLQLPHVARRRLVDRNWRLVTDSLDSGRGAGGVLRD